MHEDVLINCKLCTAQGGFMIFKSNNLIVTGISTRKIWWKKNKIFLPYLRILIALLLMDELQNKLIEANIGRKERGTNHLPLFHVWTCPAIHSTSGIQCEGMCMLMCMPILSGMLSILFFQKENDRLWHVLNVFLPIIYVGAWISLT